MNMLKIMAIGDLHLEGLDSYFTPLEGLTLQCAQLAEQLEFAAEEGATDVVLLGDLFHSFRPNQRAVSMLTDVLASALVNNVNLHIHAFLGNHDMEADNHSFYMLQQVAHYIQGLHVYIETTVLPGMAFLRYPHTICKQKNTIVFCHKEFKGTKRDNDSVYTEAEPFDRQSAIDLNQIWVSGHLHTSQVLHRRLFYPGAAPTKYLPKREHFVLRIDWDKKSPLNDKCVEFIEWLPSWGLYRVDVYSNKDEDVIKQLLLTLNQKVRVKAVVHAPHRLSNKLKNDSRVVEEGNIPKLFTPNAAVTTTAARKEDGEWIISQLPAKVRKHPYLRRKAYSLIRKAESLKG